jgi:hypothetical protein
MAGLRGNAPGDARSTRYGRPEPCSREPDETTAGPMREAGNADGWGPRAGNLLPANWGRNASVALRFQFVSERGAIPAMAARVRYGLFAGAVAAGWADSRLAQL